uniref:DOMON domain-containing protein n=1 Tax=Parastrongyloides trichosuri TaxID=131310 RepID=A0A0N4ZQE4_PARTI
MKINFILFLLYKIFQLSGAVKDCSNIEGTFTLTVQGRIGDHSKQQYKTSGTSRINVKIKDDEIELKNVANIDIDMDQFKYSEGIIISITGKSRYKYLSVITPNGNGLKTKEIKNLQIYCTFDYCEIGPVLISETVPSGLTSLNENDIKSAFFISLKSKGTYTSKKYITNDVSPYLAECPNYNWMNKNNGIKFEFYKFINDIYGSEVPSVEDWIKNTKDNINKPLMIRRNIFTPLIPDKHGGNIQTCSQMRMPNNRYFYWGYELDNSGKASSKSGDIANTEISKDFQKYKLLCLWSSGKIENSQSYLHFLIVETHDDYDEGGRVAYYLNNPPKRYHYKSRFLAFHIDDIKHRYNDKGLKQDAAAIQPKCFYEVDNDPNIFANVSFYGLGSNYRTKRMGEDIDVILFEIKKNDFNKYPHEKEITIGCNVINEGKYVNIKRDVFKNYYANYISPKFGRLEGLKDTKKVIGKKIKKNNIKMKELDFSHYGLYKCIGEVPGDQQTNMIKNEDIFLILPENGFKFKRKAIVEDQKGNAYCYIKYEHFAKLKEIKMSNKDKVVSSKMENLLHHDYFGFASDKSKAEFKHEVKLNDILTCMYHTNYNTNFTIVTVFDQQVIEQLNSIKLSHFTDKWPFIVAAVGAPILLIIAAVIAFSIVRKRRRRRRKTSMARSSSNFSKSRLTTKSGTGKSKSNKLSTSRSNKSKLSTKVSKNIQ